MKAQLGLKSYRLEEKVKELEVTTSQQRDTEAQFRDSKEKMAIQIASVEQKASELTSELQCVRASAVELGVKLEEANKQVSALRDHEGDLQRQILERDQKLKDIEQQQPEIAALGQVHVITTQLKQDNCALQDENIALRGLLDVLTDETASTKGSLQTMHSQLESIQAQLTVERNERKSILAQRAATMEHILRCGPLRKAARSRRVQKENGAAGAVSH